MKESRNLYTSRYASLNIFSSTLSSVSCYLAAFVYHALLNNSHDQATADRRLPGKEFHIIRYIYFTILEDSTQGSLVRQSSITKTTHYLVLAIISSTWDKGLFNCRGGCPWCLSSTILCTAYTLLNICLISSTAWPVSRNNTWHHL